MAAVVASQTLALVSKMSDPRQKLAQFIFDNTQPTRKEDGTKISIPFDRWRDDAKAHFLKLADIHLSK